MRVLVTLVVVLVVGCSSSAGVKTTPLLTGAPPSLITGPCPVTTPPPIAITPPPTAGTGPNPNLTFTAGPGSFLYGNDVLVVLLPNDGTLHGSDPSRGLSGGVKFPWWRIGHGALVIATRRLDAVAAPQSADVPDGYGDTGFQVSGLNFPSPGCWQVSGTIGGKTLSFVVNVAALPASVVVPGGCGMTQVIKGGVPAWLDDAGAHNNPDGLPYAITTPPTAAGFVFGYPLRAGHPESPANKILWVVALPREGSALAISAHPVGKAEPLITVTEPANSVPGEIYPTIVDVPEPGCWHLDLTWAGHQTSVELEYQ